MPALRICHLAAAVLAATILLTHALLAAERPPVTVPRAMSGDTVIEPEWAQRLTITVGPEKADLAGTTDETLQAAVDYAARLGGGTIQVLPGTYRLRNAIYLQSKVRLVGAGAKTVLIKEPSTTSRLAADTDWYDQEITLADAAGFEVGDGIALIAKDKPKAGTTIVKRTLVARSGNRFKLDRAPRENFWQIGDAKAATLFPLLSGENVTDVAIEDLVLDGNRAQNENLNGNYAGCIFLQDCNRVTVRGVTARNYNGDGISWQICHDMVVENCVSENNAGLGLHPGSGSQRPVIRNNRIEGNDIGIFFCWGVKYGLAERNQIIGNRLGVSIGHRDTDNLICGNEIVRSKDAGILFRPERGKEFAGHRNRIERNQLTDNGGEKGFAIDVQGGTESIAITSNQISDTRGAGGRVAVRLGKDTRDIKLEGNTVRGFAKDVEQAQ